MSGKDNIIAEILQKAENEKTALLNDADAKCKKIEETDADYIEKAKANVKEKIIADDGMIASRKKSVAALDVRKILLSAKQEKISQIFDLAEKEILSLPQEKYQSFILTLLEKYAEDGDTVVLSKKDSKKVSKQAILQAGKEQGKQLNVRADGEFLGGIILESKKCDKNLTLAMLLKEYRTENEGKIATILFGE